MKRQGEVVGSGRKVTLVEAPGWWSHYPVDCSPQMTKRAIQLSPGLCDQGPHVFLFVIRPDMSFTEHQRSSAQQHLELLGADVWSHTMVLFTHGDWLGDTSIEEYIESEGEALQWLIVRCGNRYHLLNNYNSTDRKQVIDLLEKIDKMKAGSSCDHFMVNRSLLRSIEERSRMDEISAEERMNRVRRRRHDLGSTKGQIHQPLLRILLLGFKYSGKSSTGNTILGKDVFELCSMSNGEKRTGEVAGRKVTVVTPPSWWYGIEMASVPVLLKQEAVLSVSLCDPGPHAALLLICIDDIVTGQYRMEVDEYLSIFSEDIWSHTMVVFTYGDWLGETTTIEQHIENEGEHLKCLIEKCGNRYHVINNKAKGDITQVTELLEKIEEMVVENNGRHYEMDRGRLREMEERRRNEEERIKDRLLKVERQRREAQALMQHLPSQQDLRIVSVGCRQSGKSSSGNTILGKQQFDLKRTAQCVKRQGEVAGRQLTVVEAPGWWIDVNLKDTPKLTKQEIVLSACLCTPGPHVVLLHVGVAVSLTPQYVSIMMEHLQHLGEAVWNHTMVLFTGGDYLGDRNIEQHIESEDSLQCLVEKCGNRYHVLNNLNRTEHQVTELLAKIDEVVAQNRAQHFEMDGGRQKEAVAMWKKGEERAQERQLHVGKQRAHLQSVRRTLDPLPTLRVLSLGCRGAGKSSSGNTILGREAFDLGIRTAQCVKRQGEVAGRQLIVVEAPGWWSDVDIKDTPILHRQEIGLSVSLCPPGPHIVLLHVRVADAVKNEFINVMVEYLDFLGGGVLSHTMVLFTRGDWLGDTPIEQYIESEGALQTLVQKCGNRYHVLNNIDQDDREQVTDLLEKMEEIICGNGGSHYEMDKKRLEEVMERRMANDERASRRLMELKNQRIFLQSLKENVSPLSDVRLVLLGHRGSGKSSSGNTILGREEFDLKRTAQCVKRQGEVAGRLVTVVEAPGWWSNISLKDTPEFTKQEIVVSASLCPPGPHILLLIVHVASSYTAEDTRNIQDHLEFVGDNVWTHTMVLFTRGDSLVDMTIEQYIESEEHLQRLVDRCGNRYHVLNNRNRTNHSQVTELLEKIEEIVVGKNGRHYEVDKDRLGIMQERRSRGEVSAYIRRMKVKKQRQHLQSLKGNISPLREFRVVLLGFSNVGKSSSGNTILGREEFDVKSKSTRCVKRQGEVAGRQVTVVKAPGWWKNQSLDESPALTKQEIVLSVSLCPPGPHILLLLIRITDFYRESYIQNLLEHVEFLGNAAWTHTMVLFTHGDLLGETPIELYIESEGVLQSLVEKCGNRYHVLNNMDKGDSKQTIELLEKMEEIIFGNGGRHYEMDTVRLAEISDKMEREEERAKERLVKVNMQREHLQFLKQNFSPLSEVRVVLLGHRGSGKSSSGNTILGREEFDLQKRTAQCVKRQGEVAGRKLTVVEAPGWWADIKLKDTPDMTKHEIVLSSSLCPPGPHSVVLVINVFSHISEEIVQKHLELLGCKVWSHTMVLFTHGDLLGNTSIEQYIQKESALHTLVEKCGNRYHVINNEIRNDGEITELLAKIEEMVAGNDGCHFEVDEAIVQEVERTMGHLSLRVEDREMTAYKQDNTFKFVMGDLPPLQALRFMQFSYPVQEYLSEDTEANDNPVGVTLECDREQWDMGGREVTRVHVQMSASKNTLEETRAELVKSLSLCGPGPHAFGLTVLMYNRFTKKMRQRFQKHLELLGDGVWDRCVVMFYLGGNLLEGKTIEEHVESEGLALQWLVEKCGNRLVLWTGNDSRAELLRQIDKMAALNGGGHFKHEEGRANQTTAAAAADWKMEVQQMVELKEEKQLAQSKDTPPQMGGDDRSEITPAKPTADWKMEVQQIVELKEEKKLAKSMDTAPNMGGDDRFDITPGTPDWMMEVQQIVELKEEKKLAKSMDTAPNMGGDDRPEITPAKPTPDWKMEVQQIVELKEEKKLAKSMDTAPNMGGDDVSDVASVSSFQSIHISDTASEAPSEAPSEDSGIGSLTSGRRKQNKISEEEAKISGSDQGQNVEQMIE
ncbi:uncharacterized protein LOC134454272 [Engraulis encrasicolus]|uniref:uncharacterized protein LOC134454272 n=1 Tax=Engraulis encrasicolus TaxID=184585 RepID=UPI002FCF3C98